LAERYPVLAKLFRGSVFNLENAHRYEHNEITLDVKNELPDGTTQTQRTRVDSFTLGEAVVSRKGTQLAEINASTAKQYIDEFTKKYAANDPATTIADTAKNRASMPGLIGEPLRGRLYLEIPEQRLPIPANILEYAAD
jgi:hypothetical protein